MSNMVRHSRIPLLVIGGGIGGLAAAIAASKAGQPVHVIEKAEAFTELGAGLQLGPNATRMLDRLGILADVLTKASIRVSATPNDLFHQAKKPR
jgi:3-hydroxybenzoate 6-monooxygenase